MPPRLNWHPGMGPHGAAIWVLEPAFGVASRMPSLVRASTSSDAATVTGEPVRVKT